MILNDIYEYYQKNWVTVGRELRVGSTSLYNWKKIGYIPIASQIKIEKRTKGLFVADLEHAKAK
jgi:hypothetical protein